MGGVCIRHLHAARARSGTVKSTPATATLAVFADADASGRCHGIPRNERACTKKSLMAGTKPMSSNGEQVADDVMDREEPLGLRHRFEAPHVALAPACRLV